VILAIQEAEIRRSAVQSLPRQIVCKILAPPPKKTKKNSLRKKANGVGLSSKPQYPKNSVYIIATYYIKA
jgi:hypothetical protein